MASSPIDRRAEADERYQRLLEVQTLMAKLSREIGPGLDLDHVLTSVLEAMQALVPCDGAAIALLEDDELAVVAVTPDDDTLRDHRTPSSSGIAGRVFRSGTSARSDDLGDDERLTAELRHLARQRGVASYLCVPLICLGESIGVLQVFAERPAAFTDDHLVLFEGLAIQVAGAIESARRYRMITQLEVLKSDFIARVSHELRTPITIVSGFVSTLLSNHDRLDSDTRQRMLERVDGAAARLSGLIDQLLTLSRLEAGVIAATSETVEAATVLEEVRRQSERPDAVEIECPAELRWTTDSGLVVRALGFLVDNALKYAGHCNIVASERQIEVIDRGPGIAVDHRSQVFERFTRVADDTSVPGMGIGLPMARTLLGAAGAELVLEEPDDGIGTKMVVRFR